MLKRDKPGQMNESFFITAKVRILRPPQDMVLMQMGQDFRFECRPNIDSVTPIWYHNGRLIDNFNPDS
ncbi:hypothetical protein Ciccas_000837 [Cichlidogyrus casuarinus]|uniref:Uncharacterized protein n=1 Tax=Cichlidogyrus casuarinus TaxID=1844966 RepID=A0ABD2QMX7_9PLAT